jgi:transposase
VYQFADKFNGHTFHEFLLKVVAESGSRKVFMVIDNGPCHWLDDAGKQWLAENGDKIELWRLPPYSPDFNPVEGVWKATRKMTTHNRFYPTVEERDAALCATFELFREMPKLISNHVARIGLLTD